MRHATARRLRSAIAAFAGAGATCAALLAGCGSESGDASASDSGLIDTHPVDGANHLADDSSIATPHLTFVNATHDLGPASVQGAGSAVRFCFKQGASTETSSVVPLPPLPERNPPGTEFLPPGIASGTGQAVSATRLDFSRRIIVPIVIRSAALRVEGDGPGSAAPTCTQLMGAGRDASLGLVEDLDYWTLPAIQTGTLAVDRAYVVVLSGCAGTARTQNPGKCGPGFVKGVNGQPGLSNLKLTAYATTGSPVAAPFGAQVLHASTQADATFSQLAAKGAIRPGFFRDGPDGGTFRPITDASPAVGTLTSIVTVDDVAPSDSFALGPGPLFPSTLAEIGERSGLTTAPRQSPYPAGRNYVFIAVGDPDPVETSVFITPDGGRGRDGGGDGSRFNLRSLHFLAYPADGR